MAEIDSITSASNGTTSLTALKTDIDSLFTSVGSLQTSVTTLEGTTLTDGGTYVNFPNTTEAVVWDAGKISVDRYDLTDSVSKYGMTVVLKKSSGTNDLCSFYAESWAQGSTGSVFGMATVAGTGDQSTDGTSSAILIGGEFKLMSQYHDNASVLIGCDLVFSTRSGESNPVLHAAVGNNKFNDKSVGLRFSNQVRSSVGEYCGWATGIQFYDQMDRSSSQAYTCLIDFCNTTTDQNGDNPWIFTWSFSDEIFGIRFNTSNAALEFYRDITGTPVRKGYLLMTEAATDHAM